MHKYDPRYDMPPRVDRFINKHPAIFAFIVITLVCAAMAVMEYFA